MGKAKSKRVYAQITGRKQKNDVIAYQVRQSFLPGEITSEEANKVGYEFAKRFTKGNHAFIVCTHIDKKHIHNHIIWNSTTLDCMRKSKTFGVVQKRLSEIAVWKKEIINYRKSGYSKKYYAEHEADIIIHKAAKKAFDEWNLSKIPSLKELNAEYAELLQTKKSSYAEYVSLKKEIREMMLQKQNYEFLLDIGKDENAKSDWTKQMEK